MTARGLDTTEAERLLHIMIALAHQLERARDRRA
jgi:hypothetical protein